MRRTIIKAVLGVFAIAVLYAAWPVYAAWQLRQAVKARDLATLEHRVDWPVLRANMKPRLLQAVRDNANQSSGLSGVLKRAVGETVADRGIDWIVTPKNLSRLLAGREFYARRIQKTAGGAPPASPPSKGSQSGTKPPADPNDPGSEDQEDPEDPMPPRRIRWAFFESPTRFRIEAVHPRLPKTRIVSILGQSGFGWKLIDVAIEDG